MRSFPPSIQGGPLLEAPTPLLLTAGVTVGPATALELLNNE